LSGKNAPLQQRVSAAAEPVLDTQGHVSFLEVLVGLGWMSPNAESAWRRGRIEYLWVEFHGGDLAQALKYFDDWGKSKGLEKHQAIYTRASREGVADLRIFPPDSELPEGLESLFRMQYLSPSLPERKRQNLEKQAKAPQPVVFSIIRESVCSECGAELWKGDLLFMDGQQPLCLACAGMANLEYLGAGDAAMTRRSTKYSSRSAVVVRFSKSRGHYERQGILVEPEAIARAEQECAADADDRAQARKRGAEARAKEDRELAEEMTAQIRALFPKCPPDEARKIAEHTAERSSGRVGRSAAGRALNPEALTLAVRAAIRHRKTDYDAQLARGVDRETARSQVRDRVEEILDDWRT
jgi:hypothetical protein